MQSLREFYKIGNGPSSSHTMGPKRAAEWFKKQYPEADKFEVYLYGSLAFTGQGHLTDKIIEKTLLPIETKIVFDTEFTCTKHPNTMDLVAFKDGKEISRKSLRNKYGMVLQDTWLFNSTIRENIAYGNPNASLDDIIEAAKLAGIHEYIEKLPKKYDTEIIEGGSNLSQGEKQLICIARVMLLKPPMLILDEATSNIDTRTEKSVQEAFDRIMAGRTSFIVAHRLSTITSADIILVMNKGQIIEQGNHAELLKKKGFYANLYNSQFEGN
mgnify:CR=1 FL=1